MTSNMDISQLSLLTKAAVFAAEKHSRQRRKDKDSTPYINHPLTVGEYLVSIGKVTDPVVIAAAYLHDTIEDTDTTYEELVEHFGSTVADIVLEVTDDKTASKLDRKLTVIEHASSISTAAKQVKIADMLHNMSSILTAPPTSWSPDQIRGYFVWAYKVYLKLRDCNESLAKYMDKFFAEATVQIDGTEYSIVPTDEAELDAVWNRYIHLMTVVDN